MQKGQKYTTEFERKTHMESFKEGTNVWKMRCRICTRRIVESKIIWLVQKRDLYRLRGRITCYNG